MTTYSALTTLPGRDRAEALADALETLDPVPIGIGCFEIEDGSGLWEVGAYFLAPPDPAGLALLEVIHGAASFAVSKVPDEDWVDKVRRELTPVEAGRYFVHGSHDAHRVPMGSVPLLIEAAMAFGTGHHGTTQGCLRALDRLAGQGVVPGRVADIGCGTAVLAMAAAHTWPCETVASDIDEVAVEVAEANLQANGLAGRVACVAAAGFDHPVLAARGPYDLVFANILKAPLIDLAPDMATQVADGGWVILSGLLTEQAEDVLAVYARSGFNLVHSDRIVDWATLTLRRSV